MAARKNNEKNKQIHTEKKNNNGVKQQLDWFRHDLSVNIVAHKKEGKKELFSSCCFYTFLVVSCRSRGWWFAAAAAAATAVMVGGSFMVAVPREGDSNRTAVSQAVVLVSSW